MSKISPTAPLRRRRNKTLTTFSADVQNYGTYFAGFPWQFFCTGTFRTEASREVALRLFKKVIVRIQDKLKSAVEFIAVPEQTTSGLGMPPGLWHWHFVICGPAHRCADLMRLIEAMWKKYCGNVDVCPYEPCLAGAFYLAKTAERADFEYLPSRFERITSSCPKDLFAHQQHVPYVPEHFRHRTHGQTLRLCNRRRKP